MVDYKVKIVGPFFLFYEQYVQQQEN